MVQRCENHMAVGQDVWDPPTALHSVGPVLCEPHTDAHCHSGWWCYQWHKS